MKQTIAELRKLENDYWDLVSDLDTFEYIQPLNVSEEKDQFFKALSQQQKYNPQFTYKDISFDLKATEKSLLAIKSRLKQIDHPLIGLYNQYVKEDLAFLDHVKDRTAASFQHWLSRLYGFPNESQVKAALGILESVDISESKQTEYTIDPFFMESTILKKLETYQIRDWQVSLEESAAKVSVNPVIKKIKIKKDTLFHQNDIQRLLLHEIGVHVLRTENGSKQEYLLFSKGFPNYLQTEEGIAIWAEKENGLLSDVVLTKYCCRLIAAHYCRAQGFFDIFQKVTPYLNDDDCFDLVVRLKRGLVDTSKSGGFTKDQIYLRGLWDIEKLDRQSVKKLFVGKVGVQHIELIEQLDTNMDITYPEWLNKI